MTTNSFPAWASPVAAGQTLYLRVYPYNTSGAASGKTLMLANVDHLRRDELAAPAPPARVCRRLSPFIS